MKTRVNILSLDGGGTRGYLQAYFLEKFCNEAGISQRDLAKKFDLICGTSVGGICAMAYAIGMTPAEMQSFFLIKSPWIFTTKNSPSVKITGAWMVLYMARGWAFYESQPDNPQWGHLRLYKEIKDIFGDMRLSDLSVPVFVTGYDFTNNHPLIFGNINVDFPGIVKSVQCSDALEATSAAPLYLPAKKIIINGTERECNDGGVYQNNPVLLAKTIAQKLYPYAKKFNILSVGTGIGDVDISQESDTPTAGRNLTGVSDIFDFPQLKLLIKIINITMSNAQIVANQELTELSKPMYKISRDPLNYGITESDINYYRFDVNLDLTRDNDLDNSLLDFFEYLRNLVDVQFIRDEPLIRRFINGE